MRKAALSLVGLLACSQPRPVTQIDDRPLQGCIADYKFEPNHEYMKARVMDLADLHQQWLLVNADSVLTHCEALKDLYRAADTNKDRTLSAAEANAHAEYIKNRAATLRRS
jgi:hypothetical protein